MSRVGKKPIEIPQDVSVVLETEKIKITGKYGSLEQSLSHSVKVEKEGSILTVKLLEETKKARSAFGLTRALIQNMVTGVKTPFSKILLAEGVGYKFQLDNEKLIVSVGFSHPVVFVIPSDLQLKVESNTKISISGIDKEKVGFLASKIRAIRPPEPYKGKGIQYEGDKILRKAGKTGK